MSSLLINHCKNQFGINGGTFSWLHSYLTSRTQYVKYSKHSSATMCYSSGVPEMSVLGSLLFKTYVLLIGDTSSNHMGSHFTDDDVNDNVSVSRDLPTAQLPSSHGSCGMTYIQRLLSLVLQLISSQMPLSERSSLLAAGCNHILLWIHITGFASWRRPSVQ